jgi:hypothetical protein
MPSLFATIGAVVVVGTTAAVAAPTPTESLASTALAAAVTFALCTATFLAFRAVWCRSHFDEPPTRRQSIRGYVLYFGMPLCVLVVGVGVALLSRPAVWAEVPPNTSLELTRER